MHFVIRFIFSHFCGRRGQRVLSILKELDWLLFSFSFRQSSSAGQFGGLFDLSSLYSW